MKYPKFEVELLVDPRHVSKAMTVGADALSNVQVRIVPKYVKSATNSRSKQDIHQKTYDYLDELIHSDSDEEINSRTANRNHNQSHKLTYGIRIQTQTNERVLLNEQAKVQCINVVYEKTLEVFEKFANSPSASLASVMYLELTTLCAIMMEGKKEISLATWESSQTELIYHFLCYLGTKNLESLTIDQCVYIRQVVGSVCLEMPSPIQMNLIKANLSPNKENTSPGADVGAVVSMMWKKTDEFVSWIKDWMNQNQKAAIMNGNTLPPEFFAVGYKAFRAICKRLGEDVWYGKFSSSFDKKLGLLNSEKDCLR
jgi:hypothetical protein